MLDDVRVIIHCDFDCIRVDFKSMILNVGKAELFKAVPARRNSVIHGQNDEPLISRYIQKKMPQDMNDDFSRPPIAETFVPLRVGDAIRISIRKRLQALALDRKELSDHIVSIAKRYFIKLPFELHHSVSYRINRHIFI